MDFLNKVVIITGASSGIGAGAAEHLSKLGAKVVLTGRNEANLMKVAENCKNEVLPLVSDVTSEADRKSLIDETIKRFGKIDVLVNNAGFGDWGEVASFPMDRFNSLMDTNVRSVFHLTQLSIPHLIKSKGNIVNISSIAGLRAFPGVSVYCMTKAALDQFTRCLALELAPQGVRVNAVNPAYITSNFRSSLGMDEAAEQQYLERVIKTHPIGRVGTTEDTSQAIAFLACNNTASFVTGTTLSVDGGRTVSCPR